MSGVRRRAAGDGAQGGKCRRFAPSGVEAKHLRHGVGRGRERLRAEQEPDRSLQAAIEGTLACPLHDVRLEMRRSVVGGSGGRSYPTGAVLEQIKRLLQERFPVPGLEENEALDDMRAHARGVSFWLFARACSSRVMQGSPGERPRQASKGELNIQGMARFARSAHPLQRKNP